MGRLNGSKKIEGWDIAICTNDEGWSGMDPTLVNTAIGDAYWYPEDRVPPEPIDFDGEEEEVEEEEEDNDQEGESKLKLSWRPLRKRIFCDAERLSTGDLSKYCTYQFHGLTPTSPYQVRIRAFCTTGNGGWSTPSDLIFTTKEDFDIRAIVWEAKTNGVPGLVALMQNPQFLENPNVQTRCVRSLRLIAANTEDEGMGYQEVYNANVLEITLDSLTNNHKDPSLLRWSCRMFSIYWNVLTHLMLEKIVQHSRVLIDIVAVAQWSCALLRTLVENKKESGAMLLSRIPGAIDIPLLTATKHSLRAALFTESLECLNVICTYSKSLCTLAANEKKGIDIVKAAVVQQIGSTVAEELAARVVVTLAQSVVVKEAGSRPGSRGNGSRPGSRAANRRASTVGTVDTVDNNGTTDGEQKELLNQFDFAPSTSQLQLDATHTMDQQEQQKQQQQYEENEQHEQHEENEQHEQHEQHDQHDQHEQHDQHDQHDQRHHHHQQHHHHHDQQHHHHQQIEQLTTTTVELPVATTAITAYPMTKNTDNDDDAVSVATTARTIGSLRSRLHEDEIEMFEWIEASLHREQRDVGLELTVGQEEGIDPLFWTEAEKQQDRHARHKLKHDRDNHPWFAEFDQHESNILMALEKEIRINRKWTQPKEKNSLMKQALEQARKGRTEGGSRPGTASSNRSMMTSSTNQSNRSKYSVTSSHQSGSSQGSYTSSQGSEEEEEEAFTPGQIIGKNASELLVDFWAAYPGFERHIVNLAKDGFDDLEALLLAKYDDLIDCGLGPKSAKVLLKLCKKEKPYWKIVFAAQREYNWYLRSLGHQVQIYLKHSPTAATVQPTPLFMTNAEEEEYGSEYTDSNYSGYGGGQNEEEPSVIGASEVMSELDNLLDF